MNDTLSLLSLCASLLILFPSSLRNNMFELADHLVGIYKTNNCTKSITIDPRSFIVAAQQVEQQG